MELTWRNMSEKFESVKDMKLKLIDSFPDYVPSTPTFQVGCFEDRGNQKRWVVQLEDLKQMYQSFREGDSIKLWCEAKGKENHLKRANENKDDEPKSKRERQKDIESEICSELEAKHGAKFTGPVYTLWAKGMAAMRAMIPPSNIPLITGEQRGRKKRESLSEAITDAATASTQAVKPAVASPKHTPTVTPTTSLSPNNQETLRRRYLEDLRTLSQLLNGVLTDSEFQQQKETLLNGLRKLK